MVDQRKAANYLGHFTRPLTTRYRIKRKERAESSPFQESHLGKSKKGLPRLRLIFLLRRIDLYYPAESMLNFPADFGMQPLVKFEPVNSGQQGE